MSAKIEQKSCCGKETTMTIDNGLSVLDGHSLPFGEFSGFTKHLSWEKGGKTEKGCKRPCIRKVFRPLSYFAKCFGLFPAYDLSFMEKLNNSKVNIIQVVDYIYSGLVCFIITSGAIFCMFYEPQILSQMKNGAATTDYYVITALFYMAIVMGVWSLFVFPKSSGVLIRYLNHFAHVDKILEFDGRYARNENQFARKLLLELVVILCFTLASWWMIFVSDLEVEPKWFDYVMVPVISIAVMTQLIPTIFFLFFLNSIYIRILQFNEQVRQVILPITPSCFACKSFEDYGKELDSRMTQTGSEQLAFDLEKLRILHGEVSDLVYETSCIFGAHLIRDFASSMVAIILYSYFIIFLRTDQGDFWPVYIVLDIFSAGKLVWMCLGGDCVKNEASALLKLLQKVSVLRVSPECNMQIQMFIKKLDSPMNVTASGFFNVDRRLLTAIVSAISTYFVILIQFKATDTAADFSALSNPAGNFSVDALSGVSGRGKR